MTAEADHVRGHDFLPPEEELALVPPLYATEATPLADKVVWIHYFVGACDWYVMEYDPAEGLAFGWADLSDPQNAELGYMTLGELRRVVATTGQGQPFVVERDLAWKPRVFAEVQASQHHVPAHRA